MADSWNFSGGTRRFLLSIAAAAAVIVSGCSERSGEGERKEGLAAAENPCGASASALTAGLPKSIGTDEISTDCAAWLAFVALNWRADPTRPGYPDPAATAADFGNPADNAPKVWETYLEAAAVFAGPLQGQWQSKRPGTKQLFRTSKFHTLDLTDITQAGGGHHWLTNQRGDITYYEVMMNRDEYEFITQAGFDLTTAAGQEACASQPGKPAGEVGPGQKGPIRGGFNMPQGNQPGWVDTDCAGNVKGFGDGVGAMEIKAAWTPLPADGSLNARYKTATAQIQDPVTKQMRTVTVGLVGLHIARKRFPRAEWVWATFEHIDNAPDSGSTSYPPKLPPNPNLQPGPGYTFFNPQCDPTKDPYFQCKPNAAPTRCQPGGPTCQPYNAPMQITRLRAVPDPANQATAWFWSLLPKSSVYNYYRLIDVQWPTKPQVIVPPGRRTPAGQASAADMGTPTPQGNSGGVQQILANTTLESFQQDKNACMDCHVYASIAQPQTLQPNAAGLRRLAKPSGNEPPPYASDFSFLFGTETSR